jgi:predicted CXXCH cytochrome family protein
MRAAALLLFAAAACRAQSEVCAACHSRIYESFRRTGMGRSFYRPEKIGAASYYHEPSEEHYAVTEREGRFYQRRHQLAADGSRINVLERSIDFVLGSGNHARTFLHRNARGEMVELPLAWYSENGGTWAMNPGYDRPDHPGFQRKLDRECIFCHSAGAEPAAIDCQRCHGPGDEHVRRPHPGTIVNPAKLTAQSRLELCLQCHLESSARALPYAVRRYGRDYFSYRPGEPLADYMLHFDRAGGAGNTFEIAHSGYRFLQSPCYRRSNGALGCTTCHNPHEEQHGAEAVERYQRVCRNCHATLPARHTAATACLDCHMPKRRTDDVVHAVMTDHAIPRRMPAGDLLAPKREAREADTIYRGKVVLLYPPKLTESADTELYLSLAQVIDGSDYQAGIPRLRRAIDRNPAARPEFYAELANTYSKSGRLDEALRYFAEALRRQPALIDARLHYALALHRAGRAADAAQVLERAPASPEVLNELGFVYLHAGKLEEAVARFRRALAADPDLPEVYLNLATALSRQGDQTGAVDALRTAVTLRPNLVAARNNLASILNARGDFDQAREHFRFAIRIDPNYAPVRYNYGRALEEHGALDEAEVQLRTALRLNPRSAEAFTSLGMVLAGKGRWDEAIEQYQRALDIRPDLEAAKVNLDLARKRK